MNIKNNKPTVRDKYKHLIHSARALSLTKNKKWIENVVRKGFVCLPDGQWNDDWADNYLKEMFQIIDALDVAYRDNWDMHVHLAYSVDTDRINRFTLTPLIYYPETVITNSNGASKRIKDLIVSIPLVRNYLFSNFTFTIDTLRGTKFNYEYDDFHYNYKHSHLPCGRPRDFNDIELNVTDFCLGSESEIGELMLEIRGNGFDEGLFGLYLTMVDTVVSWESLEGRPHAYLEKVTSTEEEKQLNYRDGDLQHYYQVIGRILTNVDANFVYNKDRYQVKNDKRFNDYLKNVIIEDSTYIQQLLCKEKNGNYYSPKTVITALNVKQYLDDCRHFITGELPYVFIQGRKVELRINSLRNQEEVNINEYNVYPKFVKHVIQELEQELYEKAVRSSAITAQHSSTNA